MPRTVPPIVPPFTRGTRNPAGWAEWAHAQIEAQWSEKVSTADANATYARTLRPVASRTAMIPATISQGGRSNGTDTGGNYRIQHDALCPAHGLRLVYANVVNNAGAETAGANNITVRAAIEAGGVYYPVLFGGKRDVVIEPGAVVTSDPVGFSCGPVAATNFYTRTYVTVASAGMTWPLGFKGQGNDGTTHGTTETDKTTTGTITTAVERLYGPTAILGTPEAAEPFVAIVGDSITAGFSDANDNSWITRALTTLGVPYINLSAASEAPFRWASNPYRYRRAPLLDYCTHIICEQGINQINNTTEVLHADMLKVWQYLAATGLPVFQTTITPKVTSSDSYATLAGQTVTADESKRLALNAYIRSAPAPLSGVIEIADLVESARDSGKFNVDGTANKWTSDGIHLTTYGHTTVATGAAPLIAAALGIA